uniref:Uncharacterized protein n=1 Tax=Ascaris lumbricoides TaxID=6252 RepID=A0A0M3HWE6_ASCLU
MASRAQPTVSVNQHAIKSNYNTQRTFYNRPLVPSAASSSTQFNTSFSGLFTVSFEWWRQAGKTLLAEVGCAVRSSPSFVNIDTDLFNG